QSTNHRRMQLFEELRVHLHAPSTRPDKEGPLAYPWQPPARSRSRLFAWCSLLRYVRVFGYGEAQMPRR
ncbi:MAG: hypothetical protein P4L87_18050, partial [Formivibrio sp.]|nr:hypothetical protein [Formivibrio sp.]